MRTFTRDDIINCFKELDKRLPSDSDRVTVYMIGGGAMATRYDSTRVTTDVDYTATGPGTPAALAAGIAATSDSLGLKPDWMNNVAESSIPRTPDREQQTVYDGDNLTVVAAGYRHLIAMKLNAGRDKDVQDLLTLCERNGIDHPDTLVGIAAEVCDNPALLNDRRLRKTANRVCNHPRISGQDTRVRIQPSGRSEEIDAPVHGANVPEGRTPPKNHGHER